MLTKQDLNIFKIASKDNARPILTGVLVTKVKLTDDNGGAFNSDAGHAIKLAATDSYTLTEKLIPVEDEPEFDKLLIPAETLQNAGRLMAAKDTAKITKGEIIIFDRLGEEKTRMQIGHLIEGDYPKYEQLIPGATTVRVSVNPKLLAESLAQADTNTVELQISVNEKGQVDPHAPILIDSKRELTGQIISVVMPLRK